MTYTRLNPKVEDITLTPATNVSLQHCQAKKYGNVVIISFDAKATGSVSASGGWVKLATASLHPASDWHFPATYWISSAYESGEAHINSSGEIQIFKSSGLASGNLAYCLIVYTV